MIRGTRCSGDRGSATVELVVLTPVLLLLLSFMVLFGRIAAAEGKVAGAARDAARSASLTRSPSTASGAAEASARRSLAEGSVECRALEVRVDTREFRPGGSITTTVTCTVDLGDLGALRVPAERVISKSFSEPVDRFRGASR